MAATWILSIGLISIDNFGLTERLKVTEDLKLTEENEHAGLWLFGHFDR